MSKPANEYTLTDWAHLRPLTHFLKSARYRRVDRRYRAQKAAVGDAASVARTIHGRRVLFTVGFGDPEAIEWQAMLVRHFVPDVVYVVVDNTPQDSDAAAIERVAANLGVTYLRAPPNPWPASSRSHGIVLNWLWHNVVRPGAPSAFGLLDDDLFPTAPHDPFEPLKRQDVFGVARHAGDRWFLWAGFTMMRFDAVRDLELDFGQDWFIGLDTGGGNWRPLYSHMNFGALEFHPTQFVPYRDGIDASEGPLQWAGSWLHEVGQVGRDELAIDKRRVVAGILGPHLAAARLAFRREQDR